MSRTDPMTPTRHRAVRSFVLRGGRLTVAQERALAQLWPRYGIDFDGHSIDFDRVFGRPARRCLEIGFGTGEVLADLAAARPETDFIGIEVHSPGVGRLLLAADARSLGNVRVIRHDAVPVLEQGVGDSMLDEILIFFPDPWHKKRHHKRRLIQPAFVATLARKLKPGGVLRLATDWLPYAEHMLAVCSACAEIQNLDQRGFTDRPDFRPPTRFEMRGERLGHGVWDLAFQRISG